MLITSNNNFVLDPERALEFQTACREAGIDEVLFRELCSNGNIARFADVVRKIADVRFRYRIVDTDPKPAVHPIMKITHHKRLGVLLIGKLPRENTDDFDLVGLSDSGAVTHKVQLASISDFMKSDESVDVLIRATHDPIRLQGRMPLNATFLADQLRSQYLIPKGWDMFRVNYFGTIFAASDVRDCVCSLSRSLTGKGRVCHEHYFQGDSWIRELDRIPMLCPVVGTALP